MPPDLPPSVLAALGLAMAGCTGKACLDYAATETGDTAATDTTTYGPCLDYAPPETGGSGGTEHTGDTGLPPAPARAAVLERLAAEDVLPADVIARLRGQED